MSSQVELCEHHAKDCLQAAERTEDPLAREMLLRHALEWMRDGLAASKQSKLCVVCGRNGFERRPSASAASDPNDSDLVRDCRRSGQAWRDRAETSLALPPLTMPS